MVQGVAREFLESRGLDGELSCESHLSLVDLGLDSITCLELMAEVERRAAMTIPERHWEAVPRMTLGALADLVAKRR